MRKQIVAGNWKMNLNLESGKQLAREIKEKNKDTNGVEVILIPPFIHLASIKEIRNKSEVQLGSQNNFTEDAGAYTGEVSVPMIKSCGASYGLVGHSERRAYFNETEELLSKKTRSLLKHGLKAIYCCGESLEERKGEQHFTTVEDQLKVLWDLSAAEMKNVVVAYEPVWAIGTGETASAEQAQEMHAFIRGEIKKNFSEELAEETTILYGGSCKPNNAKELFSQTDVDGGLIGGASLNADDFTAIINSF